MSLKPEKQLGKLMKILASLFLGLIMGCLFAIVSDSLVRAVRDFFHLELDIHIYSILENTRKGGALISGFLGCVIGYIVIGIYGKSEKKWIRSSVAVLLFLAGLILTTGLSILFAIFGAAVAGINPGDFGWSYLYALYGGGIFGLIGFFISYISTWMRRRNPVFSFVTTALIVPAFIFMISLTGHWTVITAIRNESLHPTTARG